MALRRLQSHLISVEGPSQDQVDGRFVPSIDIDDDTGQIFIGGRAPVHFGDGWTMPGSNSSGSSPFIFMQNTPQSVWTVLHNLNRLPSITIIDSSGQEVLADVHYDNSNQITVQFSAPLGGTAYLI